LGEVAFSLLLLAREFIAQLNWTMKRLESSQLTCSAVSLSWAAASVSSGGSDVSHGVAHTRANTGAQVAEGVNGFKLLGMTLGLAVHALGSTMGAYGVGMSVYSRFLARISFH
jgi:hypothetical protein